VKRPRFARSRSGPAIRKSRVSGSSNTTECAMNCSLELHDSRVSSVQSADGVVTINFKAAYLHRSDGAPGSDEGMGWVQSGYLEFASAKLTGGPDIGEGWIVDGSLKVDGVGDLCLLPVPFDVGADRKLTHWGCGQKLGLVKQQSLRSRDARRGCGSRGTS
jgi:hypothetical protein